jgi:hypothetical protein
MDDDNLKECMVCKEPVIRFYKPPCGHQLCQTCAKKIKMCPMCRQPYPLHYYSVGDVALVQDITGLWCLGEISLTISESDEIKVHYLGFTSTVDEMRNASQHVSEITVESRHSLNKVIPARQLKRQCLEVDRPKLVQYWTQIIINIMMGVQSWHHCNNTFRCDGFLFPLFAQDPLLKTILETNLDRELSVAKVTVKIHPWSRESIDRASLEGTCSGLRDCVCNPKDVEKYFLVHVKHMDD